MLTLQRVVLLNYFNYINYCDSLITWHWLIILNAVVELSIFRITWGQNTWNSDRHSWYMECHHRHSSWRHETLHCKHDWCTLLHLPVMTSSTEMFDVRIKSLIRNDTLLASATVPRSLYWVQHCWCEERWLHKGGCIAQRLHSCFWPSGSEFDSQRSQEFFSSCYRDLLTAPLRTVERCLIRSIKPI